jgi:hypothetical protein
LSSRPSKNVKIRIYKNILPVVLYGCETWSLTLREEYRLRVFESRVLRRILGSKRDEVTGEWRKLHNEEHHVILAKDNQNDQVKEDEIGTACSTNGSEDECIYDIGGKARMKETTRKTKT